MSFKITIPNNAPIYTVHVYEGRNDPVPLKGSMTCEFVGAEKDRVIVHFPDSPKGWNHYFKQSEMGKGA